MLLAGNLGVLVFEDESLILGVLGCVGRILLVGFSMVLLKVLCVLSVILTVENPVVLVFEIFWWLEVVLLIIEVRACIYVVQIVRVSVRSLDILFVIGVVRLVGDPVDFIFKVFGWVEMMGGIAPEALVLEALG